MGKKKGGGKKGGGKGKKSGKASAKSIRSAISDHNKDKELDVNSKEFWMKQASPLLHSKMKIFFFTFPSQKHLR